MLPETFMVNSLKYKKLSHGSLEKDRMSYIEIIIDGLSLE